MNNALFYLYLIFLSPFFYRNRLKCTSKVNKVLRYALFITFIYPLILQLHFMQSINGKVGYSFFVFVFLDNKIRYEHYSVQMTLFYYCLSLFSFVFFASGKKYYNKNNLIILMINFFISLALFALSFLINFNTANQSIYFGYFFFYCFYINFSDSLHFIYNIFILNKYNLL